jgi:hypothetical protein
LAAPLFCATRFLRWVPSLHLLGNQTGMTEAERVALGRWVNEQK